MRILVTGGTGFIGSNIALELLKQGHDVHITGSMYEQPMPEFEGKIHYLGVSPLNWEAIGTIDALVHQGGISDARVMHRNEVFRANVEGSQELFTKAVEHGAHHIVYASSTAVYGNMPVPYREDNGVSPLTPYAESKAALDAFAMDFAKTHPEVSVIGLRYSNVYGPRENHKGKTATMIYQFAQQMKENNPKLFRDGEQKRDYIYVKDVVKANLLALEAKGSFVVNCGSGVATSFNDLISILNATLGKNRTPEYIDNPYGDSYQSYTLCDMTLAKERLGFSPSFDIENGVRDYFDSGFLSH